LEEGLINKGSLWPEALLQLNPAYERLSNVSDLCSQGLLHPLIGEIFYDDREEQLLGDTFYHPEWKTGQEIYGYHDPLGFAYPLIVRVMTEIIINKEMDDRKNWVR